MKKMSMKSVAAKPAKMTAVKTAKRPQPKGFGKTLAKTVKKITKPKKY